MGDASLDGGAYASRQFFMRLRQPWYRRRTAAPARSVVIPNRSRAPSRPSCRLLPRGSAHCFFWSRRAERTGPVAVEITAADRRQRHPDVHERHFRGYSQAAHDPVSRFVDAVHAGRAFQSPPHSAAAARAG